MKFTVIRPIAGLDPQIHRQQWEFEFVSDYLTDMALCLNLYQKQSRKSNHHASKWSVSWGNNIDGSYSRLMSRSNTIKLEDVPWPEDVIAEAKSLLAQKISACPVLKDRPR